MGNIIEISIFISMGIILLSFVMVIARLIKGPVAFDRLVAFDLFASLTSAIIILFAIKTNVALYIDVVLAITLIAFLSTIAIAKYLNKKF